RARFSGRRMLCIMPLIYDWGPGDHYVRSAREFGFTVEVIDRTALLEGATPAEVGVKLERAIDAFRPDFVLYNTFFELPFDEAVHAAVFHHTAQAFEAARRRYGTRVVAAYRDAWSVSPERMVQGLGTSVDLVQHFHPLLLQNPVLSDPRVFCYFHP